MTGRNNEISS